MDSNSPDAVISSEEIIHNAPEKIASIDQLKSFLETRGPLFFSRLAAITKDIGGMGREKITPTSNALIKSPPYGGEDSIFTSSSLCIFASYALYDGLKDKMNGIDLDVVGIQTDLQAENWDKPAYVPLRNSHIIITATSEDTGKTIYADPTYRQIDHRYKGGILLIEGNEFDKYYKPKQLRPPVGILDQKQSRLHFLETDFGLTKERYEVLVKTLN